MSIALRESFHQVCVWPGTNVETSEIADFERFFLNEFKTRIHFLETVVTGPSINGDIPIPGSGGRHDVFFAIHDDDVMHFATTRLALGIRWVDDAMQDSASIWPDHIREYTNSNK